jgi:TonB family protein
MALPGLVAFASLNLGARAVPIIASVVLHAGIAAGLVASAAGHAQPGRAAPTVEMTIDVDPLEPVTPPPLPEREREREREREPEKNVAAPTHTHPYPVDPSHDARPHDPALAHDHADDHHPPSHEAEPAAPALVAEAAALPRFDLGSGAGAPLSNRVASQAPAHQEGSSSERAGTGAGQGGDDVVHAASAVQVPARLVQSVAPAYPAHARADDVEGDVGVEIVVDREGRVVEARVTRPAGHGFDASALTAVRGYRFSPAQREGHAVRVRMPWSVQFRLR